jgi:plasmid maintenance system killer protein
MKYAVTILLVLGCFVLLFAGTAHAQYNYNKNNVYKPPVKNAEDEKRYQENVKKADKKKKEAEDEKARDQYRKDKLNKTTSAKKEDEKEDLPPVKRFEEMGMKNEQNGITSVKINGKWGFINAPGDSITPMKYDKGSRFSNGLAAVSVWWRYGYIDETGREVIPLMYDFACALEDERACVQLNNKWGFIDKKGKLCVPINGGSLTGIIKRSYHLHMMSA